MLKVNDIVENLDKIEKSHTYQSGLSGAVEETGKALATVGEAVNAVLLPVRGMIWGAEQIAEWMNKRVSEKLKDIPPEKIIPPNPHVAGPAIEALKFTAHEEELREMFAQLLANSINIDKNKEVHPAFVDLIKSMNSIDARVLKELSKRSPTPIIDIGVKKIGSSGHEYLARNVSLLGVYASLDDPWQSISVIDNLERMGLVVLIKHTHLADNKVYSEIQNNPDVKKLIEENAKEKGNIIHTDKGAVEITSFGKMFVNTCVA